MATTTSITTTYAGEHAGKYIAAALLSANTLEKGGLTIRPNVKYKEVVSKLATSGLLASATCDFTPTGSITKTERILQPAEMQVNLSVCKTPFASDWQAAEMGYSAHDNLPKTFSDFLIGHISASVATDIEGLIWTGSISGGDDFDGYVTLATADSDVVDVAGVSLAGGGITASNVIAELGKVVDAIPSTIYGAEDLRIFVSQDVYRAYIRALGGFGASGLGANGFEGKGNNQDIGDVWFDGVKIFVANGLGTSYMFAAQTSNLWFGTGLMSDMNEVAVIDQAPIDGSKNVNFIMRLTAAVQYGIGAEIVLYTPTA